MSCSKAVEWCANRLESRGGWDGGIDTARAILVDEVLSIGRNVILSAAGWRLIATACVLAPRRLDVISCARTLIKEMHSCEESVRDAAAAFPIFEDADLTDPEVVSVALGFVQCAYAWRRADLDASTGVAERVLSIICSGLELRDSLIAQDACDVYDGYVKATDNLIRSTEVVRMHTAMLARVIVTITPTFVSASRTTDKLLHDRLLEHLLNWINDYPRAGIFTGEVVPLVMSAIRAVACRGAMRDDPEVASSVFRAINNVVMSIRRHGVVADFCAYAVDFARIVAAIGLHKESTGAGDAAHAIAMCMPTGEHSDAVRVARAALRAVCVAAVSGGSRDLFFAHARDLLDACVPGDSAPKRVAAAADGE